MENKRLGTTFFERYNDTLVMIVQPITFWAVNLSRTRVLSEVVFFFKKKIPCRVGVSPLEVKPNINSLQLVAYHLI